MADRDRFRDRFGVHHLHIEKHEDDDLYVYLVCPHTVPDVIEEYHGHGSDRVHLAEHPCSMTIHQGPDAGYWMPRVTVDVDGPGGQKFVSPTYRSGYAALLHVNVIAPTYCIVEWETSQVGVIEMMGGTLRDDWPPGWPKTPGVYEVFLDSDGSGERYTCWIELVDQTLMEKEVSCTEEAASP